MNRRWLALPVATVAMLALVQPPAQAVTITKQGTPSTRSASADQPFVAANTRDCSSLTRGHVFVDFDGDYIGVADQCRDGRGVMGVVNWQANGERESRRCQNLSGVGTKVQCQFNWPDSVVPKSLIIYVRAATGSAWEVAGTTTWIQEG